MMLEIENISPDHVSIKANGLSEFFGWSERVVRKDEVSSITVRTGYVEIIFNKDCYQFSLAEGTTEGTSPVSTINSVTPTDLASLFDLFKTLITTP